MNEITRNQIPISKAKVLQVPISEIGNLGIWAKEGTFQSQHQHFNFRSSQWYRAGWNKRARLSSYFYMLTSPHPRAPENPLQVSPTTPRAILSPSHYNET